MLIVIYCMFASSMSMGISLVITVFFVLLNRLFVFRQSQLPTSMHISTRSVSPNPSPHNFSEYLSSTNDVWNDRSDDEDLPVDFSEGSDLRNDKKSSAFKSESYKKDTDSSSSGIQTIINSDGVKAEVKQIVEGKGRRLYYGCSNAVFGHILIL